jgi:hypothetical protein
MKTCCSCRIKKAGIREGKRAAVESDIVFEQDFTDRTADDVAKLVRYELGMHLGENWAHYDRDRNEVNHMGPGTVRLVFRCHCHGKPDTQVQAQKIATINQGLSRVKSQTCLLPQQHSCMCLVYC